MILDVFVVVVIWDFVWNTMKYNFSLGFRWVGYVMFCGGSVGEF